MKIGICGEHGGEPRSIRYLHATGVDYVSCSPFRVPIARLVAAQAAIAGANLVLGTVSQEYSVTVAAGLVTVQTPNAGASVL